MVVPYLFMSFVDVYGISLILGSLFADDWSFLFDYLAYYGFFALLLFTAWWREYKLFSKRLPDRYKKAYFYFFIPVVSLYIFKAASVCILLPFMSLVFTKLIFLFILEDSSTALSKKH